MHDHAIINLRHLTGQVADYPDPQEAETDETVSRFLRRDELRKQRARNSTFVECSVSEPFVTLRPRKALASSLVRARVACHQFEHLSDRTLASVHVSDAERT